MQKQIQPPTRLAHGLHVLKPRSFPLNLAPKMGESLRDNNCSLDYGS
jgi:hypothetical protein